MVAGWFAAAVAIPVAPVDGTMSCDEAIESIVLGNDLAESRRGSPDVPPPRA
jgi:hypothetical protein